MKDKISQINPSEQKILPSAAESLSEIDRVIIDNGKMKSEIATEKVKTALALQGQAAAEYDNIVLRMALKYKLQDGDVIEESGTIKRNS
jgi:hypothetical protein